MDQINKEEIENIIVEQGGPYSAITFMAINNYPNLENVVAYMHTIRHFHDDLITDMLNEYKIKQSLIEKK